MSTVRVPTKYRILARVLEDAGFTLVRAKGDHNTFTHPDGRLVVLPFRRQGEVSKAKAASAWRIAHGNRARFCGQS